MDLIPCPFCGGKAELLGPCVAADRNDVSAGCYKCDVWMTYGLPEHIWPQHIALEYGHKGSWAYISSGKQARYRKIANDKNESNRLIGVKAISEKWNTRITT